MESIEFLSEDIERVQQIIENHEGEPWTMHQGIRELWLRNDERTAEFQLLFLFDIKMTVSRVAFKNKRTGTMTEVMAYCEQFAKEKGVRKIVIQSVETSEMAQWCRKHGYEPNPTATVEIEELLIGDYEKDIEAEKHHEEAIERLKSLPIKVGDKVMMDVPAVLRYSIQECSVGDDYLLHMIDHPQEIYTVESLDAGSPFCPYMLSGAMAGYSWAEDELIPVPDEQCWFDAIKDMTIDEMADALAAMAGRLCGTTVSPGAVKLWLGTKISAEQKL